MSVHLHWLKRMMLPAAKAYASRKLAAGALIAASISGFLFVEPLDTPAIVFCYVCLAAGTAGLALLVILAFFPPQTTGRPRKR